MRSRTLLISGVVVATGIATWALLAPDGLRQSRVLESERARLDARVELARAENAALIAEANALGDDGDPRVLEQVVREELGHVKTDEVVVVLDGERDGSVDR